MTERTHIYRDSLGVRRTSIWEDDNPSQVTVKTEQDLTPILDGIARDRETMRHGVNKLAARIPLTVYEDLKHRGIADDEAKFKAWLNSSEATPWRIWPGRM